MLKKIMVICAILMNISFAKAEISIPELKDNINFTGTLQPTDLEKGKIKSKLNSLEKDGKVQMAVLVVDSIRPYSIEEYSIRVAEKWKLGDKGINNGVLFIVATKDRKTRIEVGRGLEGVLTDTATSHIQREIMSPMFKVGNYVGGIIAVIDEIKIKTSSELPILLNSYDKKLAAEKDNTEWGLNVLFVALCVMAAGVFFLIIYGNRVSKKKYEEELKEYNRMMQVQASKVKSYTNYSSPIAVPIKKNVINQQVKSNKVNDTKKSNSDDYQYVAASAYSNNTSNDDDNNRKSSSSSSSSSDSYSGGGGDFGGGGSSSDY